jgi:predicted methyltransferase MtxX (methanogen marker protein 4)
MTLKMSRGFGLCAFREQADSQQKEKEDLEEISTELELVDEEEKVP